MTLQPLGNKILAQRTKPEEKINGIIVPKQEDKNKVIVMATGPECPKTISTGDIIYIANYQGTEINHNSQNYIIIDPEHVLAKISP